MAAGKHTGKVVIKMREEEPDLICKPEHIIMKSKPRFYCESEKSYIILGMQYFNMLSFQVI